MNSRSTNTPATSETASARVIPVLARVPRVGVAANLPALPTVEAFELPTVDIAPLVENATAKPQAEVELPQRKPTEFKAEASPEPDHKVTLASRLFRMHEAVAPHSGFIMAATLLVAGGLLMWMNSTSHQEGVMPSNTFAFSDSGEPGSEPKWASSVSQEKHDVIEKDLVEEQHLLQDLANADTTGNPSTEGSVTSGEGLTPLPAPYAEGGYHSTGYGSNYLTALRKDTDMANRPTQESR